MARTPQSASVNYVPDDNKLINPNSLIRSPLHLAARCRDCFHFKHTRAPQFSNICSELGILEAARPCPHFLINATIFNISNAEGQSFAEFIGQLPQSRLTTYAALFSQERTTRRSGFRHGEEVYVHLFPGNYLSNFAKAWVIMADRQRIFVQGRNHKFRGVLLPTTVLNKEAFDKRRKVLRARRRLIDPNLAQYTGWKPPPPIELLKTVEQPTIDDLGVQTKIKTGGKPKRRNDLTKIFVRGN